MKLNPAAMEESTYMSFDTLDIDSVILPNVPSRTSSDLFEWTRNDEILLDPEDRPLELAVNANSAVTFNIVAGSDRTAEVLRNLHSGSFTPLQRKKLMERFNIDDDMMSASSDFGDHRTSQSSASESTGKCDSLEGSPITSERNRINMTRNTVTNATPSLRRKSDSNQRQIMNDLNHLQNGKTKTTKADKLSQIFSVATLPRHQNGKPSPKAKRPHALASSTRRGRDQTVSASARKIFSSLRKSRLGRSASRERSDKQSSGKANATITSPQEELSSDIHLPGILKVFGDAVSPGANYKSVLATRQSDACELVKTALERYGVPRSSAKKFVLCEVVGRLRKEKKPIQKENGRVGRVEYSVVVSPQSPEREVKKEILEERFTEDYIRPLNDHEKPLILQSFWKPLEGYARRFELRKRSEVLDQAKGQKDTQTREVNAQAKRLILQKTRLSRTQSSLNIKVPAGYSSDEAEDDLDIINEHDNEKSVAKDSTLPTPSQFADDVNKGISENGEQLPVPFIITLQGEDGVSSDSGSQHGGSLIHYMKTRITVIGREQEEDESTDTQEKKIRLRDDEIKPRHCIIDRIRLDVGDGQSPWVVTLRPFSGDCYISVNGVTVSSCKEISNGDIIAIGSKFLFMLKDPSSTTNLASNMRLNVGNSLSSSPGRLNSIASRGSAFTPVKKRFVECEINYRSEFEDHVLEVVFSAANDIAACSFSREAPNGTSRELAPARLLCHCIEQACFNFSMDQKRSLLFIIATNLQTILLDATGSVSLQDDAKIKNPVEGIHYILPKLEAVVFWMSNSLEIFTYLQKDLVERIKKRVSVEIEINEVDRNLLKEASEFIVGDDILAVLEEVVMYAFQQLVYYLTKTLYGALPKVLESNPFAELPSDPDDAVRGTGHVIAIYEAALGLTRKYGVHPAIESQLFAYLFFFTNVSLFNTLMEEEAAAKYYRWEKGVQIRGNLEEIECWANDNGFQEQANKFLTKFSTLTNLLATPKTQMLQNTWSNFRRDYPQLHPVQLRQILDGYVLGTRIQKRPADWIPDAGDLEESTEEEFILDSYDNHPPLMLPTDGTQLNLDESPTESWYAALREIILTVGQGEDLSHIKAQETWLKNTNNNNESVGMRQQPDGGEIAFVDSSKHHAPSSIASSSASSVADKTYSSAHPNRSKSLTHSELLDAVKLSTRPMSSSTNSMSSAVSDSTSQTSLHAEIQVSTNSAPRHKAVQPSKTLNGSIASPIPAPRKLITPTPSPRQIRPKGQHHKGESESESGNTSVASNDSRGGSPNKTHSRHRKKTKKLPADFTIRDFQTDPSISVNSLLLKQHQEHQRRQRQAVVSDDVCNAVSSENGVGRRTSSTDSYVNVDDVTHNLKRADTASDLRVLPVNTTPSKYSEIANHPETHRKASVSSESTNESLSSLPKEVFIVDVIKGRKGLGLGMVDGMYTSLQVPGVFVRSLVPDGPSVKHVRMRHQEVIKCWLQEGRLQLGDRILAVNGTSLISMNYTSAMNELRQAGDQMRFLVGRSGPEVAVKITSSSC